jgi:hypothetical protein
MPSKTEWTNTIRQAAIDMRNSGMSASEIVLGLRQLGVVVSRNAVLGILHRSKKRGLGVKESKHLSGTLPYRSSPKRPRKVRLPAAKPDGTTKPPVTRPYLAAPVKRQRFAEPVYRGEWTCQWIEGEGKDRTYCGVKCEGSYCAEHTAIVYQPRVK